MRHPRPPGLQHGAGDVTEVLTLTGSVHLYFTSPRDWSGASNTEVLLTALTAKGAEFLQPDSQPNGTLHWSSAGAQLTTASLDAAWDA